MLREPLKDRAHGRWAGILSHIGLPPKIFTGRHQACPLPGCGGKDRFRYDDKEGRGTWICSKCGAGDGIELVKRFLSVDFKEAAAQIEQHVGASPIVGNKTHRPQIDEQQRERMIALWRRGKPIADDDYAGRYLLNRGISIRSDALRFVPDERYSDAGQPASWHPVMIAKVDPSDAAIAEGQRAALHRTYLDKLGGKADVPSPRKMLGAMPTGAAVRLMPPAPTMGIAEGIESALSAATLFSIPVWASLTKGLMADWVPPSCVSMIWIFGDHDVSFAGQAAAYTLAERLKVKGLDVMVEMPLRMGEDWNDILTAKAKAA